MDPGGGHPDPGRRETTPDGREKDSREAGPRLRHQLRDQMAWSILGQHAGARNARGLKGPNIRTEDQFEGGERNVEAAAVITEQGSDQL